MSKKIDGPTAKKSIVKYLSLVNTLVSKAKAFSNTQMDEDGINEGNKMKAMRFVEDLKQQLKRMESRWDECDHLEHVDVKLYTDLELKIEEARQLTEEAEDAVFALLNKPIIVATTSVSASNTARPAQSAQAKSTPKMVSNFKPGILPGSANLNELNAWEKSFLAYMDANKEFLATSSNQTKRIFVTTLLDAKIQAALDADDTMIADTVPIRSDTETDNTLLKWLRAYILRYSPLYIRRYHYSLVKQLPKESFQDYLTRKVLKGRNANWITLMLKLFRLQN